MGKDGGAVPADPSVHVPGYVVGERIGAGGFGEVYRARHALMGRDVAIKVLHPKYSAEPQAIARFIAEARAVSRISHPNIVDVFDFGELADGRQFCVMELLRGNTLRELLYERKRLPLDEALPILRGIAEAVDAAHGAGIAHRDLKPDNVFVLDDGAIKLIDFGLAKLTTDEVRVTETGSVFGTPLYMSPEQCRGKGITLATDAYSFGVVAYHVLTGELPFSGDALELALHHLNDAPGSPSKRYAALSDRVDRVLLALLAKDPGDRPASLVGAIDAIVGEAPLPPAPRRRRRVAWLATAGGVAIVAGVAAVVLVPGSEDEAVGDECVAGNERLAGIWDPTTRATTEARFAAVDRVDVASSWKRLTTDLDAYSARWSTQWNEACRAPDRESDPLLYAQRVTCLENALLQLQGVSKSLATVDVSSFVGGISAEFILKSTASLEGCANAAVLGEQRRLPPLHLRAEVTRLAEEFRIALTKVSGLHSGSPSGIDEGLAEMQVVADRLEAIGLSGAREASIRAQYLVSMATIGNLDRVEPARAAIADTIRRAELARADGILAGIYSERGALEVGLASGKTSVIEDSLERGEAALRRSGQPGGLDALRAELAVRAGRLDHAVELLRRDLAQPTRWLLIAAPYSYWAHADGIRTRLIDLLARLGRHTAAIDEARKLVAWSTQGLGEMHMSVFWTRWVLEQALVRAGRTAEALSEADRRVAILVAIHGAQFTIKQVHERRMAYALELGRRGLFEEARTAALAAGATDVTIAQDALMRGSLELSRAELERVATTHRSIAIEDALAAFGFMTGDLASMKRHAERVPADAKIDTADAIFGNPNAPNAWWFLAIADASAGHPKDAEARLAKLARFHEGSDPGLVASSYVNDGWVLAELARWSDAKLAFERARTQQIWIRNADLADIDAWIGRARLEAGDPKSALEPLEECLDILMTSGARNGDTAYDGFHYFAPMAEFALARALWETGGDKARARYLAEQARDHFARLGRFKEPDRQIAIRWLADHQ